MCRIRIELLQPLDRGLALVDGIGVVLREVAYGHLRPPDHSTAIDRKLALSIVDVAGGPANQRLQQRRLPRAVTAYQRDLFFPGDIGCEALNDLETVV